MSRRSPNQPSPLPTPYRVTIPEEGIDVELKDRWLSAFLAWLIPGLGHLYQGRRTKGLIFMICILSTFFFGLYLGNGRCVYASLPGQQPYRWEYWCQLGTGLPALPAIVQRERVKSKKLPLGGENGLMAPMLDPYVIKLYNLNVKENFETTDISGNKVAQPSQLGIITNQMPESFEMGKIYTMIAGLLNILVVYDAACGPLLILPHPKKEKKKKKSQTGDDPEPETTSETDKTPAKEEN